jgi:hypothetical protein
MNLKLNHSEEGPLCDGKEERWVSLCKQAADEEDSEKFIELIREINDILEAMRSRLKMKYLDEMARDVLLTEKGLLERRSSTLADPLRSHKSAHRYTCDRRASLQGNNK